LQLAEEPDKKSVSKALRRAATLLPRWQKLSEQLPVHDCLDKIFSQGNIIKRYIAANKKENEQKVAANCQRFLELSLETNNGRYPSITRFLQDLYHLKNYSSAPPEEPLSQNKESRVRLMTIHGSKGLEAPVVFLADCNNMPNNKNAYNGLIRWPANRPQPTNFQLQLNKENTDEITAKLQQEKLAEQSREELNLLYVAITRARERLFISGTASSRRRQDSWYQIIANGLHDLDETETGIDEIRGRAYKHLCYDRSAVDTSKQDRAAEEHPLVIDRRLLKPIGLSTEATSATPDFHGTEHPLPDDFSTGQAEENTINDIDEIQDIAIWRGIIIHRILELLCNTKSYPATKQIITPIYQQLKTQILLQKPAYIEYLDACLDEAATTFNHPECEIIFNPDARSQTYNEMPLMYITEQRPVNGIVDRVIRTEDSVLIIDYKSHQLDKTQTPQETAQQFSEQLNFYRDGIKKLWPGHEVKTGILFTHHKEIVWLA
jgi:ATP-dependent helicase/nuclease subunit A